MTNKFKIDKFSIKNFKGFEIYNALEKYNKSYTYVLIRRNAYSCEKAN